MLIRGFSLDCVQNICVPGFCDVDINTGHTGQLLNKAVRVYY
jgi:hypothetical protein